MSGVTLTSNPTFLTQPITGNVDAVYGSLGTYWDVTNETKLGAGYDGIDLASGGYIVNAYAGRIGYYGAQNGVVLHGYGRVVSFGDIAAKGYGVDLLFGGVVYSSGVILSDYVGLRTSEEASYIFNGGSISGTSVGISLAGGGHVYNNAGRIAGETGILANFGVASVTNNAGVYGDHGYGVQLGQGGRVVNSGFMGSRYAGAVEMTATGTVQNSGEIESGPLYTNRNAYGVLLLDGGTITNTKYIFGYFKHGDVGIGISGAAGTVINSGYIKGSAAGITLISGGTLTNTGILDSLYGAGVAIDTSTFGGVTNLAGGTIRGLNGVVSYGGNATVMNAGAIYSTGSGDAIKFSGGPDDRLIVDPGASFGGTVDGGTTAGSALELANTGSAGSLSGLGTQFIDFNSITLDAGGSWSINGAASVAATETVTNSGTLQFLGGLTDGGTVVTAQGTLILQGAVGGSGTIFLGAMSDAVLAGTEAVNAPNFNFTTATGTLALDTPTGFTSAIAGFVHGDTIDLVKTPVASLTYSAGVLTVKDGATVEASLHFSGSFSQASFAFHSDGQSGTDIVHT